MMLRTALSLLFVGSLCLTNLQAQEQAKPGTEHKFLAEVAGNWDVTFLSGGQEMKGTCQYKTIHDGLWISSDLEMDMGGMKFSGHGLDSYDPVKKKFISIWIDNMSSSPVLLEGNWSEDKKKITMTGKGPDPSGKQVDYKAETEYLSKDKHIFKMWMGDLSGEAMMKATYTRKK